MNRLRSAAALTLLTAGLAFTAWAADVTGKWTATFNTQVGEQHYTYTFKVDGEKLTGTAKNEQRNHRHYQWNDQGRPGFF